MHQGLWVAEKTGRLMNYADRRVAAKLGMGGDWLEGL